MKWKTKTEKPKPQLGDRKTVKEFVVWPCDCIDGTTRWFETLFNTYEYRIALFGGHGGMGWVLIKSEPLDDIPRVETKIAEPVGDPRTTEEILDNASAILKRLQEKGCICGLRMRNPTCPVHRLEL